jgi:uncharacterized protein Smg (DUF494 family)
MNERVVEILVLIMSEIRRSNFGSAKLELLSKDLRKKGYTESEISSAFSWLLNRIRSDSEELVQNQGPTLENSFRVLHEIEKSVISPEAYGYILQLKELNIISETDIELILERALMMGTSRVDPADIKLIVASMLWSADNFGSGGYFLFDDQPGIH